MENKWGMGDKWGTKLDLPKCSGPDIAKAVREVAQYCHDPTEAYIRMPCVNVSITSAQYCPGSWHLSPWESGMAKTRTSSSRFVVQI